MKQTCPCHILLTSRIRSKIYNYWLKSHLISESKSLITGLYRERDIDQSICATSPSKAPYSDETVVCIIVDSVDMWPGTRPPRFYTFSSTGILC